MICEELKSRKNFVEEDFIELKNSVEEIIKIFEKYKDMRKNSKGSIEEMKRFLGESYFNSHINSISEYGVYDKNDLEKTHKVNREITVAVNRFGKILYKITEKVIYHMI